MADDETMDGMESEEQDEELPLSPDWILLSLIDIAERIDAEIPITLLVSGRTITGSLIGSKRYLLESIDDFKSFNQTTELGQVFLDALSEGFAKRVASMEQAASDNEPPPVVRCINLKNPVLVNDQTTHSLGTVWRGRIDSVDGWSFGSLSLR